MHPDWNDKDALPDFQYSTDEEQRAYRTQHSPKAKRRVVPPKKGKPGGIYRRRNHRWAW